MSKKSRKNKKAKKVNNEVEIVTTTAQPIAAIDAHIDEAEVVDVIEANPTSTTMADIEVEKNEPIALGPSKIEQDPQSEVQNNVVESHHDDVSGETDKHVDELEVKEDDGAPATTDVETPAKDDVTEPCSDNKDAIDPDDCIVWRMSDGSYVIKSTLPVSERTGIHAEWVCESSEKANEVRQKLEDAAQQFAASFNEIHSKRLEREEKIQKRIDTVTTPVKKIKGLFNKKSA